MFKSNPWGEHVQHEESFDYALVRIPRFDFGQSFSNQNRTLMHVPRIAANTDRSVLSILASPWSCSAPGRHWRNPRSVSTRRVRVVCTPDRLSNNATISLRCRNHKANYHPNPRRLHQHHFLKRNLSAWGDRARELSAQRTWRPCWDSETSAPCRRQPSSSGYWSLELTEQRLRLLRHRLVGSCCA